ncbi:MAG: T9SS type A sorting domain-containing protein [Bacteroidota bacterium]|nr:T9SS type A sorting domain-containing protein [Bacteroidota bacterium]
MKKITILLTLCSLLFSNSFGQIAANDVELLSISTNIWARPGDLVQIKGSFKTKGTDILDHCTFCWSITDGEVYSFVLGNLNMSKNRDSTFTHPDLLTIEGSEDIILKVWVSEPNGEADVESRRDTLYRTIQIIGEFPERNIILEEFTGAWCGWCPRGPIVYRDQILPNYPNVILAALHNGDDMVFSAGNSVLSAYASAFPSGMIDRKAVGDLSIALSTNEWIVALNQMDTEFTPASINVYNYYYPDTYIWKIDVVVDFIMDFSGSLRLNCFILEDSVTGTGSGYNQSNSYNTRDDIPELKGIGNPIIGYKHNHVVREMLGGAWGQGGIIPSTVKRGDRYIFSRVIKQPGSIDDIRNTHLVGVLQAYSSNKAYRTILNASKKTEVSLATGYNWTQVETKLKLYPNPVSDIAILEMDYQHAGAGTIEVVNIGGQTVYNTELAIMAGKQVLNIDTKNWDAGVYFVRATQNERVQVIKLVKK